jgi:geranylgeranylglycerol-phosphate geranylgeranyltransferase
MAMNKINMECFNPHLNQMKEWISILRPVNGVMGIVATWISAFIGVGTGVTNYLLAVAAGSVVVFLVTSAGNILNDYLDVETDRINHPARPLVTGKISSREALIASVIIFLIALVLAYIFISLLALLIVVVAEAMLILYEVRTKGIGLSGNASISILVGLIFIFGGICVDSLDRMILLFGMASLTNFSREIIKDIQDISGDRDRKTFPMTHGIRMAGIVSAASVAAAIAISFLPYYYGIFGIYYLAIVIPTDIVFITSIAYLKVSAGKSQQVSKLAMILGLVSFAVGGYF